MRPCHREGNDVGQDSQLTYKELLDLVCQIANYLTSIGVKEVRRDLHAGNGWESG